MDLHILIQSAFTESFSSNEARRFQKKKKNADFKKTLRNSSKVEKGTESPFWSLWNQRRPVHNYKKSVQKRRTSFVTQLYIITNSFQPTLGTEM